MWFGGGQAGVPGKRHLVLGVRERFVCRVDVVGALIGLALVSRLLRGWREFVLQSSPNIFLANFIDIRHRRQSYDSNSRTSCGSSIHSSLVTSGDEWRGFDPRRPHAAFRGCSVGAFMCQQSAVASCVWPCWNTGIRCIIRNASAGQSSLGQTSRCARARLCQYDHAQW